MAFVTPIPLLRRECPAGTLLLVQLVTVAVVRGDARDERAGALLITAQLITFVASGHTGV